MQNAVRLAIAPRSQRGAIALMFMLMLLIIIAFIGLALDLGRIYNRGAEHQAVATMAALAAARQLNGTGQGIDAAVNKAAAAANVLRYSYYQQAVSWDDAALSFSSTPDGGWVSAAAAQSAPQNLLYARVTTADLDESFKTVQVLLMRALLPELTTAVVSRRAVAGRATIDVLPLGICAMSPDAAAARLNPGPPAKNELVEYGFRRGVAYDLMQLNPYGSDAQSFLIDPFTMPGAPGSPGNFATDLVGPYVCTGQLAIPRITGGALPIQRPFPLASLHHQLNSRFNDYPQALCSYASAPPDTNIKPYIVGSGTPWMSAAPTVQAARWTTADGARRTVADPLPPPSGTTADQYGPLWAYARAVPYSSYVPGAAEPSAGYTPYAVTDWAGLYPPGPTSTGYPSGTSTPYKSTFGTNFLGPPADHRGVANRRVLNVALLSCPVPPGATSATVLGVGKFMMTVPATGTSLVAEFGGLAPLQSLGGTVELQP